MSKRDTVHRYLSAFWTGVNGVRKVLHLLLLLFIFGIFFGALSATAPGLPGEAALVIRPVGVLVEQLEGDPYDRALAGLFGDDDPQTLVQDIVDGLEYAKDDSRIKAAVLDLRGLRGGGFAKLRRIGVALDDFRSSGKRVIANADYYSQQAYYLASHADEIYMHPHGVVFLPGFSVYQHYFKGAIDKLRIDWNIFRVGTHKSFVEPYMRTDMSDEDRDSTTRLLDQLWQGYKGKIAEARGLDVAVIDDFSMNLLEKARSERGDVGVVALDSGLIDGLLTRAEVDRKITEYVGNDAETPDSYRAVGLHDFLRQVRLLKGDKSARRNVAIVVASGEILNGTQPPGLIGGDSTAKLLRRARHDDSVQAVVLRVDSPGGSTFASAVILDEIEELKKAGKPVVASMSSVAASGGYWISMAADRIFANSETITGSIGVFGMFPTFQRSLAAIGITTDGVGTTPWAGQLRPDRAMSDDARALFQIVIDKGYDDFISKVSEHRNLDKVEVDRIGQGQVWTGADALEFGLIDEIGDLDDAVRAAAGLAELDVDNFGQKLIEKELTPGEQLAVDLLGTAKSFGVDPKVLVGRPAASIQRIAGLVENTLSSVLRFNDPSGIYSHCFCAFEN
ncbi:MAG: signal peptide peptidase SppA [Woeseia sp.]